MIEQTAGEIINQLTITKEQVHGYESEYVEDFLIKDTSSFADAVVDYYYKEMNSGKSLGLSKMDQGFVARPAELTLVTGISSHGKTQMLMQWINQLSKDSKCLLMSMEMRPEISIARLTKIALGRNSTGSPPTEKFIRDYCNEKKEQIYIYDQQQETTSADIFASLIYAKEVLDCKFAVIDSLMTVSDVGESDQGYNEQKKFINKLSVLCKALDIHIFLVAHLRKVTDELQAPDAQAIYGSSNIRNLTDNILMVYRNKLKEKWAMEGEKTEEELRGVPDCIVYIQKQRNFPYEGKFNFYFNKHSLTYQESPS
jgi:twinkle protein